MVALFFLLFIGLELKHYIADYFLQPAWMLKGKGDFRRIGGYAHAGLHAALTGVVLVLAQTPWPWLIGIVLAEFVVHYLLDYSKILYSRGVHIDTQPARFWSLHGLDQIGHQLTYGAIIYAVLVAKGLA
ncbi:MAG: DUF3307 domain-containing protein [Devosia sp.]